MKEIFVVSAVHDNDGVVILEIFDSMRKALKFEKNDNIRRVLRKEYGEKMAQSYDEDRVVVGFHIRELK